MSTKKNTSIRMSEENREFIMIRGCGNITDGIEAIISRYREMVKTFAPRKIFTKMELQAIAGANKGTIWTYRLDSLPGSMAANIEDYPSCEAIEAEQWTGVDYLSLATKVAALHPVECISLMDAIDVMFETQKQMHEIIPPVD